MSKYLIHTDGGARSNPGPAAVGVVIEQQDGDGSASWRKEYSEYIGETTNNEAEYQAVIFALKKLKQLVGKQDVSKAKVEVCLDSELLEQQMNGYYKISDKNLQSLFLEVWNLKVGFGEVVFKHIPREDNHGADKLVNVALDKELNKLL